MTAGCGLRLWGCPLPRRESGKDQVDVSRCGWKLRQEPTRWGRAMTQCRTAPVTKCPFTAHFPIWSRLKPTRRPLADRTPLWLVLRLATVHPMEGRSVTSPQRFRHRFITPSAAPPSSSPHPASVSPLQPRPDSPAGLAGRLQGPPVCPSPHQQTPTC